MVKTLVEFLALIIINFITMGKCIVLPCFLTCKMGEIIAFTITVKTEWKKIHEQSI